MKKLIIILIIGGLGIAGSLIVRHDGAGIYSGGAGGSSESSKYVTIKTMNGGISYKLDSQYVGAGNSTFTMYHGTYEEYQKQLKRQEFIDKLKRKFGVK